MSTKRLVAQNSALNFVASVSQRIGYTITFILAARLLTAESSGAFKLGITYTSILLALTLWGLDQLLIREGAKNKQVVGPYLSNFLLLRLGLAILMWLLLALVMPFLPYTNESKTLILIMAAAIIPGSLSKLFQSVSVANEDVRVISAVMVAFSIIRVIGGAILLWVGAPLTQVAILFLVAGIFEMLTSGWFTLRRRDLGSIRFQIDLSFWMKNLKIAFPLIVISFILVVEYQFDHVILSLFWPEEEVGIYGTAATIVALLLFFTNSYQLAIFPVISRAYNTSEVYLRRVYKKSMMYMVFAALPVAIFVSLASGLIIQLIFGPGYEDAGKMLSILVWAFFFSAINISNSRLLVVANEQRMMAVFAFLSMAFNLILSFLIVPRLGGVGTAWARVLAMPVYTILALVYVQYRLFPTSWRELRRLNVFKRTS